MSEPSSSFFRKLIAIIMILSLIPLGAISVFVYLDKINTAKTNLENRLTTTTQVNSENISEWLSKQKQQLASIAKNKIIVEQVKSLTNSDSTEKDKFNARIVLEEQSSVTLDAFTDLEEILITGINNETIFYTAIVPPATNFLEYEETHKLEKNQIIINKIFFSKKAIKNELGNFEVNIPVLWITTPLYGEAEKIGNISTRINYLNIEHFTGDFSKASSIDGYIVNSNGAILSTPGFINDVKNLGLIEKRPEGVMKNYEYPTKEFTEIFKIRNNNEIITNLDGYTNYIGNTVIGAISPIENSDWSYIVEIDRDEAFIEIVSLQIILLTIISLVILVVTMLSIYFSTKLFKPIKELTEITQKVSEGDFKVRIKSSGNDEIHNLAESFNKMMQTLEQSIKKQRESEAKFRTLYNQAPTLNRTIDTDGKIIDCNDAYAKRLGYSKTEVVGMTIFDHCNPSGKNKLENSFRLWKETGQISNVEITLMTKNGEIFPALVSATSIYDKGKLSTSNSVIIDISRIKTAEERLTRIQQKIGKERLLAIGELGARLAHDLRNPLAVIKNTLFLFSRSDQIDNKKKQQYTTMMEKAVDRINHQINNVLDFVRNTQTIYKKIQVNTILKNAVELLNVPENIKITISPSETEVVVDEHQMEIVFTNILRNSIEAIGEDTGAITIDIKESNEKISITITDTGPGIPEEDLKKIFDPLFTTKLTGTGLGLAGCKSIINEHGGEIEASTYPTKFTITLPKDIEN